jgi:cation transport regulator
MPYTAKTLPSAVRKLPPHARRTFQAAFNSAFKQHEGDESKSHAAAWSAVKNKYEKQGNRWVAKTQANEEPMKIVDQLRQAYDYFRSQSPQPEQVDLTGVTEILDQVTADPENFYRLGDLDSRFVAAVDFDLEQHYGAYAESYQSPGDKERTVEADHHNNFPGSLQHRIRQVLNAFHEDETQETYLGYFGFVLAVYPDYLVTCALDDPDAQSADYWKIAYSFDDQTGAVTFGDATPVDVGTVVVPEGTMMSETPEEEDAEQSADPVTQDDGQDFKTENGQKFSKSAYLIIGDPKSPSTWKVRVEESPGKVTPSQLGAAHAALTKGFRGNKVQAGAGDVSAALSKLKGLYKSHGAAWPEDKKQSFDGVTVIAVKKDDRPDWLKQGQEPPGGDEELVQSQSYVLQADGYNETTGVLHVKGTATTSDVINSKRQVYPKEVWEDNLPRLTRKLGQGKLVGESEHPSDGMASLDRTCVKFTKLWQDGNELKFEADILPTEPYGKNLQILIQNGVAVDISSRGRGTTKMGEWRGTPDVAIVQRGFRCDAFDCVVAGASPNSTITDWQLQSTTADEEDDMPALTPDQQAQLDKMAAFADKFDAFMATQTQNAAQTANTNTVVTEQSQTASTNVTVNADAERIEKNLAKMEKTMVTGFKIELLQEASKKWPQVWVNLYKKRLDQCGANTPEELEAASVRAIEDIDSLYQSAPKFPGNGFTVEPDKGDRGFQRPIDLIEEMTRDLSDEFENASDPKGIFTQKDGDGKPILPGWFRTPRRQCQKMLMNIASHVDEAWNGPAAMNALLRLSQGYGAGEVNDYLYQTISPAGTTAVGAGGAPSSAIFIFPLVRRVFPQLIATELASVQPMDRPDGKIFFLDSYRITTGVDSLDEAGSTVSDRTRIDRSDSFSSSYANDPGETVTANLIQLRLSSKTVTAQTKKLYGNWSIEEMQDLRAYHGLDAALELVGSLSREIALEWNETVLGELVSGATGSARHYGTTAPSGYTQKEWDEYITRYIDAVSNDIFSQRYGDITHIIAGPTAWLKLGAAFRTGTNPRSGPEPEQYAGLTLTPFMAASMPNVKTYKTGFFRNVNSNIILCLRRGTDWSDTPYVWAPYMDYVSPTLTLPDGFTQKQGLMSRVAHQVVVGSAIGTVTIDSGVTGVTL